MVGVGDGKVTECIVDLVLVKVTLDSVASVGQSIRKE